VKAFPGLSILNEGSSPLVAGSQIYLIVAAGMVLPKKTYAAWPTVTGPIFTAVTLSTNGQSAWTTVPSVSAKRRKYNGSNDIQGVNGQVYVVLTKGNGTVTDNDIIAGPAIVEVGDVASP